MDDTLCVRGGEPAGDPDGDLDRLPDRSLFQLVTNRRAVQQLRDDVRRVVVGADVIDGKDIRVVERGRGASLLREPEEPIGVERERLGKDLDRDIAIEPRVTRAVHLSHPAGADRRDDLKVSHVATRGEFHGSAGNAGILAGSPTHCGVLQSGDRRLVHRIVASHA